MWYIHAMEYCSAVKRNEVLITCYDTDELGRYSQVTAEAQSPHLYDSLCMKCPEWATTLRQKD